MPHEYGRASTHNDRLGESSPTVSGTCPSAYLCQVSARLADALLNGDVDRRRVGALDGGIVEPQHGKVLERVRAVRVRRAQWPVTPGWHDSWEYQIGMVARCTRLAMIPEHTMLA